MYLKPWVMQVEHENSRSSVPLYARCRHTALALAAKEIASRCVADKRFAVGKIEINNPQGKTIYRIPQEGMGEAGWVGEVLQKDPEKITTPP